MLLDSKPIRSLRKPLRSKVNIRILFGIAILCVASVQLNAQDEDDPCALTDNKKAVELFKKGTNKKYDAGKRYAYLKESLEEDPDCVECLEVIGTRAYKKAKAGGVAFTKPIQYFKHLVELCPDQHADPYYYLGAMYYSEGDLTNAVKYFQEFLAFDEAGEDKYSKDHEKKRGDVEEILPEAEFYATFYENEVPFNPVALENVNTIGDEYLPMLSPDNELLFFTRKSMKKAKGDLVGKIIEDFSQSRRKEIGMPFDKGEALPEPFNLGDNYGGVTLSLNNKEMFITICEPKRCPNLNGTMEAYNDCDIYRARFELIFDDVNLSNKWIWSEPEKLGPEINGDCSWESQPSLSADAKTLYFASAREGSITLKGDAQGRGSIDIWYSERDESGDWGAAKKMGGQINTDGHDKAPFMHSDSKTLYFSSTGHRGAGGFDIFLSRQDENGNWSEPRNIGHPINTADDEHGLIVSADGRTAYFASSRLKGMGGLDIYSFEVPAEVRPERVLLLKGELKDEEGKIVTDAEIELKFLKTREVKRIPIDQEDGKYVIVVEIPDGEEVVMTVKKDEHVLNARVFTAEDVEETKGVAKVNMEMQRIEVGKSYKIHDIHYSSNSANIEKRSLPILDEFIVFLKENSSLKIAIHGHTDNVGNERDNMVLSTDRAFTVVQYVEDHGIAGDRLSFKGYGPSKPLANNDSAEGRASNRRTEFVITGL